MGKKKCAEIQNFDFLGNKAVKTFFLVQMFYCPMGYLASIIFSNAPSGFVLRYLNMNGSVYR